MAKTKKNRDPKSEPKLTATMRDVADWNHLSKAFDVAFRNAWIATRTAELIQRATIARTFPGGR